MSEQHDELEVFRRMLDPKRWPVKPGHYLIWKDGEIIWFRASGDPLEECTYKPLFDRW